jgi:hypothetical protein
MEKNGSQHIPNSKTTVINIRIILFFCLRVFATYCGEAAESPIGFRIQSWYAILPYEINITTIRTPKRAGIVICIIWTFSLIVSIPMLIVQRLENRLKVESEHISIAFVCAEYYSEHIYDILHTSFMFVVFYAVPMVSVIRICRMMWHKNNIIFDSLWCSS